MQAILNILFCGLLLFVVSQSAAYGQDKKPVAMSAQDLNEIVTDAQQAEININKKINRFVSRISKQEHKLDRHLKKRDSSAAQHFQKPNFDSIAAATQKSTGKFSDFYSGKLDSLNTAVRFLNRSAETKRAAEAIDKLTAVSNAMTKADQVQKYAQARKDLLKQQLKKIGNTKYLRKYNKQVARYARQVSDVKSMLDKPSKIERKILSMVAQSPAYKKFFSKHSQLAQLFSLPGAADDLNVPALPGTQTRELLERTMQDRFGPGASMQQVTQTSAPAAQSQLLQAKKKILSKSDGSLGNSKDELKRPDFKANDVNTRSFMQRLEYGGNIQTQKATFFFPVTTDVAATMGYKLSKGSTVGIGIAYKVGWGSGWKHIAISHQGVGLRSFVDIKVIKSIAISGGYEQNYKSMFTSVDQLKDLAAWQSSGLIGLKKTYRVSKKLNGNVQLLWDFLSYRSPVNAPPLLFRIGYSIKK